VSRLAGGSAHHYTCASKSQRRPSPEAEPQPKSEPPPINLPEWIRVLGVAKSLTEAERHYRELIKTAHPDVGGSHDRALRLNAAIAAARSHFKSAT